MTTKVQKKGNAQKHKGRKKGEPDPIDIMSRLAHECFSFSGIQQTIGENFANDMEQLKVCLYPSYKG